VLKRDVKLQSTNQSITNGCSHTSGSRHTIPLAPRRETLCQPYDTKPKPNTNPKANPNRNSKTIRTHLFSTNKSTTPSQRRHVSECTVRLDYTVATLGFCTHVNVSHIVSNTNRSHCHGEKRWTNKWPVPSTTSIDPSIYLVQAAKSSNTFPSVLRCCRLDDGKCIRPVEKHSNHKSLLVRDLTCSNSGWLDGFNKNRK